MTDKDDDDACSINSADEALSEMLGISISDVKCSIEIPVEENKNNKNAKEGNIAVPCESIPTNTQDEIKNILRESDCINNYQLESICILPETLFIGQKLLMRITDELIYGSSKFQSDKSFEKIQYLKDSIIQERRVLTRFENFVNYHPEWKQLTDYCALCCSALMGEEMVLFKEKLNMKPPGGSGFAPHLDAPSLKVAFGDSGPQTFVTVMVAIDDMTEKNGCLKVCKGSWSENYHLDVVNPDENDNDPDAGGRRGAILSDVAHDQKYEPIICKGGTIACFNGWVPHRSTANTSPFARRAVFLTYNAAREGHFHDLYYERMKQLREDYRSKMLRTLQLDQDAELAALQSIPN